MTAIVYAVGKMRFAPYRAAADEYLGRLRHYIRISEVEVKPETASGVDQETVRQRESSRVLEQLRPGTHLFALDERGRMVSSGEFASILGGLVSSSSDIAFAVGGAFGHHVDLRRRAGTVLAFSPMTFPHELARVMLYEQIYRAMTILKNEPYHKQ